MENASKALIIAGAILISIVLIGLGVGVLDSVNNPMGEAENAAEAQAREIFNSQFISFEGEVRGSQVRQLRSKVNASNGSNPAHPVTISWDGGLNSAADITNQGIYTVSIPDDGFSDDGYVETIHITD